MALPSLTLRNVKGTALTFTEMDTNLQNLANATVSITAGSTTSSLNLNSGFTVANSATVQATIAGNVLTLVSNVSGGGGGTSWENQFTANVEGNGFTLQNVVLNTYREKTANIGTITGTVTLDANTAPVQTAAVSGNITINSNNLNNFLAGQSVTLILRHTGNTRTFSSNIKFVNSNKTIGGTTNVTDVVTIFYDGTEYLAAVAKYQA
jgi:hypothetical protein